MSSAKWRPFCLALNVLIYLPVNSARRAGGDNAVLLSHITAYCNCPYIMHGAYFAMAYPSPLRHQTADC